MQLLYEILLLRLPLVKNEDGERPCPASPPAIIQRDPAAPPLQHRTRTGEGLRAKRGGCGLYVRYKRKKELGSNPRIRFESPPPTDRRPTCNSGRGRRKGVGWGGAPGTWRSGSRSEKNQVCSRSWLRPFFTNPLPLFYRE